MDTTSHHVLMLLVDNTAALKQHFPWQQPMLRRYAALLYASAGREADIGAIDACMDLIKQETGAFSMFRGYVKLSMAAMLSLCDEPERVFSDTLQVYVQLKDVRFHASEYLVLAAYQIARQVPVERQAEAAARTRAFYEAMKEEHRFITGYDDYIFSAMLGISELDVSEGCERMERVFQELKPVFASRNGLQGMSQVLALFPEDDAVSRAVALHDALKTRDFNFSRGEALSTLGVLALLDGETASIAQEVADTYEELRAQKGFGPLSVQKLERMLLAASLIACGRLQAGGQSALTTALATSITNILIAQQVAMAAVLASAAASSAAN